MNDTQVSTRTRVGIAVTVGMLAAMVSIWTHGDRRSSDFSLVLVAAEHWRQGLDPYVTLGADRGTEWPFPLVYPFPAVLLALPFTFVRFPDALFTGASVGLWSWAILRWPGHHAALWAVPTFAFVHVVRMSQWSALLTAAALIPSWGFGLACKPTVGAALWAAYPTRAAVLGALAFLVVSLLLLPSWPSGWLLTLPEVPHVAPPLFYLGGPLLLLGLLRWRRPEARLLVALGCVPQTLMFYETLPLFLIPRTHLEGAILAAGSWVALVASYSSSYPNLEPMARYIAERTLMGRWIIWAMYLPCLVMILRRPNVADAPDDVRQFGHRLSSLGRRVLGRWTR